jgi:integrase
MRLLECLRLRVKDVDLDYEQITVRDGKGAKDRLTVLPSSLKKALQEFRWASGEGATGRKRRASKSLKSSEGW